MRGKRIGGVIVCDGVSFESGDVSSASLCGI